MFLKNNKDSMIQDVGRFRGADPLKNRRCTSNLQSSFPAHGSSLQFLMKGFIYTEKKNLHFSAPVQLKSVLFNSQL